jgi:hypothetical protein
MAQSTEQKFPVHIFIALAILVVALLWMSKEFNNG